MRVITGQPQLPPYKCAVLPFPDLALDPEARTIDTGQDIWNDRIYVSEAAVLEMARHLGHPSPKEHEELREMLVAARDEVEQLKEDLKEADRKIEAIDLFENVVRRPKPRTQTKKVA